eukprot:c12121_g2_i2.p1 GENE.c12121_g2_i2~~c12121_g2_i2.p1  ORF type:complete len:169 (+),score=46.70 c12121_g2_i2:143-649(+)
MLPMAMANLEVNENAALQRWERERGNGQNVAALSMGAHAKQTTTTAATGYELRDIPLVPQPLTTSHSCTAAAETWSVHFARTYIINTIAFRVYDGDARTYTFSILETSVDGLTWTAVTPNKVEARGTIRLEFVERRVRMIRAIGTNTSNAYLHLVWFQAFHTLEENTV